ncbi:EamA family transporter, partial [Nostoc sp. NIES-2111]
LRAGKAGRGSRRMSTTLSARSDPGLGPLLALGAMTSYQLCGALSMPLLAEIGAGATSSIRLATAALLLAVITRPRLGSLPKGGLGPALLLGGALAGMTLCFFAAVARIPLGLVATIAFAGPLAVSTLCSRRPWHLACALLAATGVVLLVRPDEQGWVADLPGLLLAGGAAFFWGLYIVFTKQVGAAFSGLQGLSISLLVAAVIIAPVGLVEIRQWPSPLQVAGAASLGLLSPLMTCGLEMIALRRMGARPFGILMSIEPAIGVAIGHSLLGQQPSLAQMTGVTCVIVASAGAVLLGDRESAMSA